MKTGALASWNGILSLNAPSTLRRGFIKVLFVSFLVSWITLVHQPMG